MEPFSVFQLIIFVSTALLVQSAHHINVFNTAYLFLLVPDEDESFCSHPHRYVAGFL